MNKRHGTGEAARSLTPGGRNSGGRSQVGRTIRTIGVTTALLLPFIAGAQPAHAATEVVFAATGADQTWTVPAGVTSIDIAMIGGGGGGGNQGNGGGGGSVSGVLAVTPGDTLTIIVGQGGITNPLNDADFRDPRNNNFRYGGGASGAGLQSFGRAWGSGGGRSAVRSSATLYGTTTSGEILTSGGGGGGGYNANGSGGAGGGSVGEDGGAGNQLRGGGGGTQGAGGHAGDGVLSGNPDEPGSPGIQFAGGFAVLAVANSNSEGGGGGGGYFGGGGGGNNGGAGGGSSFIGSASYFTGTTSAGSGRTPGTASWPAACGVDPGLGSANTSGTGPGAGGDGCVVITYTIPPTPPAPPAPPTWTLSYDANGGTCTAPSQSGVNGTVVATYGASACTRPGYTFTGWNTRSNGTGDSFTPGASTQLSADGTLYAQWVAIQITATDEAFITGEGTPVLGDVSTNDTVPAGSQYAVSTNPSHGTVVVNPDGTFTYTPQSGYSGIDSFTYEVCAAGGIPCASGTVTITVTPRPIPPVVTPPSVPVTGSVVIPGVTPPGAVFTVVTPPVNGVVVLQPTGQYVYTPAPEFVGTDSFTYQECSNGGASCQIGTVRIAVVSVTDVDAKPRVKSTSATSTTPISFKPRTSITGGQIQIAREKSDTWVNRIVVPGKGTWVVTNKRVTFTPKPNFYGRSRIQYRVIGADGSVGTSTFTAVRIAMPGVIDGGR
jgi:uncharacterized repeat protein (TIGR02543 family)